MAKFSGKLTSPYLLKQGMEKRLWQGKITGIELLTESLIIIFGLVRGVVLSIETI